MLTLILKQRKCKRKIYPVVSGVAVLYPQCEGVIFVKYITLYNKLGKRIRKLRRDKEMSQEELAAEAGLHRAYMWEIEKGRNISVKTAYKIARALGIGLRELFKV
jgi:DNA-binding XRE family transcriptional regulator